VRPRGFFSDNCCNQGIALNFDFFRLIPHPNVCHWSFVGGRGPGEGVALLRGLCLLTLLIIDSHIKGQMCRRQQGENAGLTQTDTTDAVLGETPVIIIPRRLLYVRNRGIKRHDCALGVARGSRFWRPTWISSWAGARE
jgi:hypothetical protein